MSEMNSQDVTSRGPSISNNDDSSFACYDLASMEQCATLSVDLFGHQLACAEIEKLIGAPVGVEVKVNCGPHSAWLEPYGPVTVQALLITAMHQFYEVPQRRCIFRGANEALIMLNEVFSVRKDVAPAYTGTRVLARSVENILRYNGQVEPRYRISKLRLHAFSWSDAYNGVYTWARLGFNARLDAINPNLRSRLLTAAETNEYSDELILQPHLANWDKSVIIAASVDQERNYDRRTNQSVA